ncbi:Rrf2 family transcriptional regulator [Xylophilus sp.]|uniref:Rrf2 family transcriptional regulator n=1 Tax=Xylophilus sp. TaxID=2653893 RepID=UPI0013B98A2A|nr:Rrf2 family transcriptional regulator [Xylophilus sp.]KAF1044925.1 MAG: putative HTH-type transcriptional regulator YwnA [Xylophilus sp.]
MPTSTRFAVALHALSVLVVNGDSPTRSERIASSANTNPTVIRKLFSLLAKAGITQSQLGNGGGMQLARPAADIRLLDVYRAVEDTEVFALHRGKPNQRCLVGRNIQAVLAPRFDAARTALEQALAEVSLADVVADIRARRTLSEPEALAEA